MKISKLMFDGPVPGESLTAEPGSKPWERPPEFEDAEDALQYHIERFQNPKRVDALAEVVSSGMPLKAVVSGMVMNEAGKGIHTTHVGRIIAPVIHEYLAGTLRKVGVDFDEGIENPDELPPPRTINRSEKKVQPTKEMPLPEMVQEKPAPKKKGFMKRPETEEI